MHDFTRNFLTEWRKLDLPTSDVTFIAAISGGADSVALALALHELRSRNKLNLRVVLAHFNHHLRGEESFEDENFVKSFAEKFEFELAFGRPNAQQNIGDQKGNLEQNARRARYEFLTETAKNLDAEAILTAHTLNDQAETFLMNLIRGSGLDGLGGMKPIRDSGFWIQDSNLETQNEMQNLEIQSPKFQINLIRPLLRWAKRSDTENFCRLNEVEFRYDLMNENLAFSRVRIRKVLLPLLKDFNPKIVETLGKTAELLRNDAEILKNFAEKDFQSLPKIEVKTENPKIGEVEAIEVLSIKHLKDIFPAMRKSLLRDWLKSRRGDLRRLGAKHFAAVENLVLSRKSGTTVELPGDEIVFKKDGKLFYKKRTVEKT